MKHSQGVPEGGQAQDVTADPEAGEAIAGCGCADLLF